MTGLDGFMLTPGLIVARILDDVEGMYLGVADNGELLVRFDGDTRNTAIPAADVLLVAS